MIGRLLRPASIVRLAAVIITTVCNNMINRPPTAVVAHPGMARSVAKRVIVTAAMPAIETEATKAATRRAAEHNVTHRIHGDRGGSHRQFEDFPG